MPIVYAGAWSDYVDWKAPIEHFLWDRLEEAHREASGISVGAVGQYLPWYRMIEAEWLTRSRGEIQPVNKWLRIEFIGEETGPWEDFAWRIKEICEETARSFEVKERPELLFCVLSEESEAPWLGPRSGYFIDKFPYDKICLPRGAIFDPDRLTEVVSHEYTHALNLTLTQAKCPLWLNEGIAMLSQPKFDHQVFRDFLSGRAPWKDPRHLDAAFHAELKGETDYTSIHRAYEQSAWIVRYLHTLGNRAKFGDLMRAFNDNSLLEELKLRLSTDGRADEALRQVYGMHEVQVFQRAFEWLRTSAN